MARRQASPANRSSVRATHWQSLIAAWAESGLSQRAFCARRGILPGTFAWWKHHLSNRVRERVRRRPASARFLRVELRPGATTVSDGNASLSGSPAACSPPVFFPPLELVFPDGLRVRISADCDAELLGRVLAALGDDRC